MRDFTWNYFSMTGDVNAYLLFKEMSVNGNEEEPGGEREDQEQSELTL